MSLIPHSQGKGPHRGDPYDESGVDWPDEEVAEFIKDLDARTELSLTDWEAEFVGSNLTRTSFSPKQRKVIKKLHQKYGD